MIVFFFEKGITREQKNRSVCIASADRPVIQRERRGGYEKVPAVPDAVAVDDFFLTELREKSRFKLFPDSARLCKESPPLSRTRIRQEELPFSPVMVML